jgi:XRE family transcriptional regulator, regulator of sulfur utilization
MMLDSTLPAPPSVAAMLKRLRRQKNLSLEELSQRSGVSRSMLSQIERDATNPTVATLWRITTALGVSIDEALGSKSPAVDLEVLASHSLPQIGSADGLIVLRVLGPLSSAGDHEWYELTARAKGVLDSKPHAPGTREHLFVTEGEITVNTESMSHVVRAGELARYNADVRHSLRNSGKTLAKAWLTVLVSTAR